MKTTLMAAAALALAAGPALAQTQAALHGTRAALAVLVGRAPTTQGSVQDAAWEALLAPYTTATGPALPAVPAATGIVQPSNLLSGTTAEATAVVRGSCVRAGQARRSARAPTSTRCRPLSLESASLSNVLAQQKVGRPPGRDPARCIETAKQRQGAHARPAAQGPLRARTSHQAKSYGPPFSSARLYAGRAWMRSTKRRMFGPTRSAA